MCTCIFVAKIDRRRNINSFSALSSRSLESSSVTHVRCLNRQKRDDHIKVKINYQAHGGDTKRYKLVKSKVDIEKKVISQIKSIDSFSYLGIKSTLTGNRQSQLLDTT